MAILTEEEKTYIIEAGKSWDGKTVYNKSKDITKKCAEAFGELIWLMENIDGLRGCVAREFKSKYGDPKKRWEGKGAPMRSSVTTDKIMKIDGLRKFLELYVQGSIDIDDDDRERWEKSPKRKKMAGERLTKRVEELKESLVNSINDIEVEI